MGPMGALNGIRSAHFSRKNTMYTLVARRVVKICVRDDSPAVVCQHPLSHLGIDVLPLINSIFVELFPIVHWAVVVVVTPLGIRCAAIGPIGSGFRCLLVPLFVTCGDNPSATGVPGVGSIKAPPPLMVFFERFDPTASFLATEGSTRRMARDGRPSRPARPARWIQTDSASGVINWTTSSMSGISVPCKGTC
jgi:hypothetical protein